MTDAERRLLSRRQMLRQGLGMGLCLPFADVLAALHRQTQATTPSANADASPLSTEEDQFLNELEHASFLFFWEQGSPNTGMVKDRCNVQNNTPGGAASIAATGFGLTAVCIGEQRGFISRKAGGGGGFATLCSFWAK